jgi:transposase-like protein
MKRYSKVERIEIVREHERSGQSAAAFCRQRGVSAGSLANWRKRYAGAEQRMPAVGEVLPWIPVVVTEAAVDSGKAAGYVLAAEGLRLEVPRGFDAEETRVLWQLLRTAREVAS